MKLIFCVFLTICLTLDAFGGITKLLFKGSVTLQGRDTAVEVGNFIVSRCDKVRVSLLADAANARSVSVLFELYEAKEFAGNLTSVNFTGTSHTMIFDTLSSNLRISAKGAGNLKVFVWCSQ